MSVITRQGKKFEQYADARGNLWERTYNPGNIDRLFYPVRSKTVVNSEIKPIKNLEGKNND